MRVGLLVRTMNRHTFVVKPEVWIVTDEIDDDVWEISLVSRLSSKRWRRSVSLKEVICK